MLKLTPPANPMREGERGEIGVKHPNAGGRQKLLGQPAAQIVNGRKPLLQVTALSAGKRADGSGHPTPLFLKRDGSSNLDASPLREGTRGLCCTTLDGKGPWLALRNAAKLQPQRTLNQQTEGTDSPPSPLLFRPGPRSTKRHKQFNAREKPSSKASKAPCRRCTPYS